MTKKTQGFSLIELIIVVAIIGILTAIAIPSYNQYVIESRRTDARVALTSAAAAYERCKVLYGRYDSTNCNSIIRPAAGNTAATASPEGFYSLAEVRDRITFTLTATPIGSQASDLECTSFTLTHTGIKGATGTAKADCW